MLKQIGAGTTDCEKHGTEQIDWKCQYCCSTALFCCFGTHYMCEPCHDEYNRTLDPPLKDCRGVDCPLGIAHPPPNKDPSKGGVFPLGCGICRSEKLTILQQRDVRQVIVDEQELPEFWNKKAQKDPLREKRKIVRPEHDEELPDFFVNAQEILDEAERIAREILNRTPIVLKPRNKKRKPRTNCFALPAWIVNPLDATEVDLFEASPVAEEVKQPAAAQEEAVAHQKAAMAQKKVALLKLICKQAPKRARPHRRRP